MYIIHTVYNYIVQNFTLELTFIDFSFNSKIRLILETTMLEEYLKESDFNL